MIIGIIGDLLTIYDYNYWANRCILDAAMQVSPAQFVAPTGHSYGTLRGTLLHCMEAEYAWRMLCQHQTLTGFTALAEADFATVDELAQRWQVEEEAMRAYLAGLSDNDLTTTIRYTTDEGDQRERVLWHCLWHVVNHGTQHRSEAAVILTEYGSSPGELDFTVFLNEQS